MFLYQSVGRRAHEVVKRMLVIVSVRFVKMEEKVTYQSAMLRPQIVFPWKQLLLVAPAQFQTLEPLHSFIFVVALVTNAYALAASTSYEVLPTT